MKFNTKRKKIILTIMMAALLLAACSSQEPVEEVMAEVSEPPAKSEMPVKEMSLENEASSESEVSPLVLGESDTPVLGESLTPVLGESSSESSETVIETPETTDAVLVDEATVKAEEIRAAEKAKQEEQLRIQQAEQEKARQEAEAALKAEQEKATASSNSGSSSSQVEKPSTPAEKPADTPSAEEPTQSEPQSVAQQSGKYALNEYGNPSMEVLRSGAKVMVNPADPELQKNLGGRGTQDPNVQIPNPYAAMQPVSPYIGQANPPAAWPKPVPQGYGEYKWSPEAGCWRYYNGKASDKYVSIYGVETWAQSYLEKTNPGWKTLGPNSLASRMGIYGV